MNEQFCPQCEKWNKNNAPHVRETFFEGVMCPRCFPKMTHDIDNILPHIEEKLIEFNINQARKKATKNGC